MKTKDIVKCIRIDREINEYMAYLKFHKVKYNDIMHEAIKEVLLNKCKEFKYRTKKDILPF